MHLPKQKKNNFSDEYPFVYGNFDWMNKELPIKIHYFMANVSIQKLHFNGDILLTNDISGFESLPFESLFQRELDEDRVDKIYKRYLNKSNKLHFFTPITVTFLLRDKKQKKILKTGSAYDDGNKNLQLNFGGIDITFTELESGDDIYPGLGGALKWNKDLVNAVVIDGQHRVAALRKYLHATTAGNSYLPITFILIDHTDNPDSKTGNLEISRELFIDVNKNAKLVTESSLILLDNRDVLRRSTRAILKEELGFGEELNNAFEWKMEKSSIWEEDVHYLKELPQVLINWKLERKDADTQAAQLLPWQISSTNTIYRIIRDLIFRPASKKRWDSFESFLDLNSMPNDNYVRKNVEDQKKFLLDDESDEETPEMFSFNEDVTEILVQRFYENGPGIILPIIFSSFTPYRNVLKHLEGSKAKGWYDELLSVLYGHNEWPDRLSKIQANDTQMHHTFQTIIENIKNIYKTSDGNKNLQKPIELHRYSVGQRALFFDVTAIKRTFEALMSEGDLAKSNWMKIGIEYVCALNKLYEKGIFDLNSKIKGPSKKEISIWNGSCLKKGEELEYKDSGAKKTGYLILFLCSAYFLKQNFSNGKDVLEKIIDIKDLRDNYQNAKKNIARYLYDSSDDDYEYNDVKDKYENQSDKILEKIIDEKL